MSRRFELPEAIRTKAVVSGRADWLDGLDAMVATLEAAWSVTVGGLLSGGTEAFVAEATQADGTPAVLKVLVPRGGDNQLAGGLSPGESEITVLRSAAGDGCARLLHADTAREAMLLERLGPPHTTTNGPCSSMATSTSGTRWSRSTGWGTSWSIPTGCSPNPSTTSG